MSFKAPGYNVSAAVSAGFVKNDGAGNFSFGEAGGAGGGAGVGSGWQLIEVKDITTAATSVTFSGLDGDADGEYMLLYRIRKIPATASIAFYTMRPNGISINQDTIRRAHSTSGANITSIFNDLRIADGGFTAGVQQVGVLYLDAKTGTEARQFLSDLNLFAGAVPLINGALRRDIYSGLWQDTTTNITSLDIVANFTNGIGIGSQFCLYKKSSEVGGGAGLELIETKLITVDTNTITFSGLDGDVDKCWKLFWTADGPTAATGDYIIRPNGQVAGAAGSVHNVHRRTFAANNTLGFTFPDLRFGRQTSPRIHTSELTFYAESGRPRTYNSVVNSMSTLGTVGVNRTTGEQWYGSWEDGAGNTINITSLVLVELNGNNAYTAGSRWSLYRVKS